MTKVPQVLGELIEDRAARNGDRVFLRFKDQKFTYNEMNRFANRCANALTDRHVVKGDKIAIMLPNCPEFIHLWLGSAKIGAVEVPINTSYKGEYLRHIVDQSDSKILVIAKEFLDRVTLIEDSLKKVETIVVLGGLDEEEKKKHRIPVTSFEEFFKAPDDPVNIKIYPSDPANIIYTSGNHGRLQGRSRPPEILDRRGRQDASAARGGKDDIFYTFLPLYHLN